MVLCGIALSGKLMGIEQFDRDEIYTLIVVSR